MNISHYCNAGSICPTALSDSDNEQSSPLRSCSREFDTHLSHVGSLFKDAFGGPAPASFPQRKTGEPRVATRRVSQQRRNDPSFRTPTASAYCLAEGGLALSGAFRTRNCIPCFLRDVMTCPLLPCTTLDDKTRCLNIGYLTSGCTQGFRLFSDRRRHTAVFCCHASACRKGRESIRPSMGVMTK